MFGRRILAVCMTALVLLCPFFPCGECCGLCSATDVSKTVQNESDGFEPCCSRCKTHSERQVPGEHECPNDTKTLDCFCGGAILPVGTDCPELNKADNIDGLVIIDSANAMTQLALLSRTLPPNRCHFPPFASGRDVCALSGSYLL